MSDRTKTTDLPRPTTPRPPPPRAQVATARTDESLPGQFVFPHEWEIADLMARVAALTKFAEFCDYHHRGCAGLLGQHLACDCGYDEARDELRAALAVERA